MKGIPRFPRRTWGLLAAGAVLLSLAYPPFHLIIPSFVALVPLLWLLEEALDAPRPAAAAARIGFWAGFLANLLLLHWMVVALWHFTPLSAAGYLATVLGEAGCWSLLSLGVVTIWIRLPRVPRWIAFAAAWTTMEWVIAHLGDIAFPWLGLGFSLTGYPLLVQWADLGGARGVTFWLAAANLILAQGLLRPQQHRVALGALAASILLAAGYGTWRERTLAVRALGTVALIQPNVGFQEKWVPGEADRIVADLHQQTRAILGTAHADLVIWPEAAVPDYFLRRRDWADAITALSRELHTPIFLGGLDARPDSAHHRYDIYNAAFLFDSTGNWDKTPIYRKHYLVPVVERVPFVPPRWLSGLRFFGAFDRGTEIPVYQVGMGRFGAVICYESTFEDLPRRYRAEGAEFLINVTNDKWYGLTTAPGQHASHLVMRAIETRMGIARAANSGISEVVSPLGYPSGRTHLETKTSLVLRVDTSDLVPLYVRWGDWVAVVSLVLLAMLGMAAWRAGARTA